MFLYLADQKLGLFEAISLIAGVVTIVMAIGGYLRIASRKLWWPYSKKVPSEILDSVREQILKASRVAVSTNVSVSLLEIEGNEIWMKINFRQKNANIGRAPLPIDYKFQVNGRRSRGVSIFVDSKPVDPQRENDSEIIVKENIPAGNNQVLDVTYEMAYNRIDSEMFVSFPPTLSYEFTLVDRLSERAGHKLIAIDVDQLMGSHLQGKTGKIVGVPYSYTLSVNGGLLPGAGIYLKWRPYDGPKDQKRAE